MRFELGDERMKVPTREGPLEWLGGLLVAILESHQNPLKFCQIGKVGWSEELAFDDGEIDLNLVEPTGVDRCMDQDGVAPFGSKADDGAGTTVRRAVVGDEKHATRTTIRLPAHDLGDQALERRDTSLAFTAAEQFGTMYVPSGEICPRTGARIFVLDVHRTPRGGGQ